MTSQSLTISSTETEVEDGSMVMNLYAIDRLSENAFHSAERREVMSSVLMSVLDSGSLLFLSAILLDVVRGVSEIIDLDGVEKAKA